MSYYPYFRGKQFELIAIRENATRMAKAGFVPIVEPVKKDMAGLLRAIQAVVDAKGRMIVVINPKNGDLSGDISSVQTSVAKQFQPSNGISFGVHLSADDTPNILQAILKDIPTDWGVALIHDNFPNATECSQISGQFKNVNEHVFLDDSKLYRRHFQNFENKVLIKDGFQKRKNRDYPAYEFYSDLYITFPLEGVAGFGDFLVVGDDYSESGGPAWAIAIHLTCIDTTADGAMFIHHFVSDRIDTPSDPAGKFGEALEKLVAEFKRPGTMLFKTEALQEFLALHKKGHFPGLGYVKKLSMQHHIELMAHYLVK